ncbi:zinc finger HIT domain-containing protein 3 [Cephus cinctus]|uniref:Zinc finger HIT domain-containing protein 3 n=1 Tax=Cephus cinctus TaxID=211228 RepID=A0AAJ7BY98_CEPCN|nr:zinc finger HIT domain-containing protein 3 [Cephus cinctus]
MKLCCICEKSDSVYKCPTCTQPYCSAVCCKEHKTIGCHPSLEVRENESQVEIPQRVYDFPTEDTVPPEKLDQLRYSEQLKDSLKNPHVRQIMTSILNDPNPTKAIALAMTEPIFIEMADACLRVVEPPVDNKPC